MNNKNQNETDYKKKNENNNNNNNNQNETELNDDDNDAASYMNTVFDTEFDSIDELLKKAHDSTTIYESMVKEFMVEMLQKDDDNDQGLLEHKIYSRITKCMDNKITNKSDQLSQDCYNFMKKSVNAFADCCNFDPTSMKRFILNGLMKEFQLYKPNK